MDEQNQRRVFPLLRSDDVLNRQFAGNALMKPDFVLGDHLWSPEVAYHDGFFIPLGSYEAAIVRLALSAIA